MALSSACFQQHLLCPGGLIIARYCVRVILLPKEILATAILALATSARSPFAGQIGDVVMMTATGFIGCMLGSACRARPWSRSGAWHDGGTTELVAGVDAGAGRCGAPLMQFVTRPFSLALEAALRAVDYFGCGSRKGRGVQPFSQAHAIPPGGARVEVFGVSVGRSTEARNSKVTSHGRATSKDLLPIRSGDGGDDGEAKAAAPRCWPARSKRSVRRARVSGVPPASLWQR